MHMTRASLESLLLREFGPVTDPRRRYTLVEKFLHRPVLAATLDFAAFSQAAMRLFTGASKEFNIAGTNAADAGSALAAGGGVTLSTAGANNDQILLIPAVAINAVDQSAWTKAGFKTTKESLLQAVISLPSIANVRFFMGLKLTSTPAIATDADQALISFDTASAVSAAAWRHVSRNTANANLDVAAPTRVAAVAAATTYLLEVKLDSTRYPHFYVNGELIGAGQQLKDATDLIPFVGLQALTAAAKSFTIWHLAASRLY